VAGTLERRVPNELVTKQILPSYARHLARVHARPDRAVKSVRIYRALHMIPTLEQFHGFDPNTGQVGERMSPYHPTLYWPYFQGRYARDGRLADPTDPMLFWLVPITVAKPLPDSPEEYKARGGYQYYFNDYVSKHAGCQRPEE
jgi:hypothetical protein